MLLHMNAVIRVVEKALVALFAGITLLADVESLVELKVVFVVEPPSAFFAFVWGFAGVGEHVAFQENASAKHLSTKLTFIFFFLYRLVSVPVRLKQALPDEEFAAQVARKPSRLVGQVHLLHMRVVRWHKLEP